LEEKRQEAWGRNISYSCIVKWPRNMLIFDVNIWCLAFSYWRRKMIMIMMVVMITMTMMMFCDGK
jgi:hypothetical protein